MTDMLDALLNGDDIPMPAPKPPIMTIDINEEIIAKIVGECNFYLRLAKLCDESGQKDNARINREIVSGILTGINAVSRELFAEVNSKIEEPVDGASW